VGRLLVAGCCLLLAGPMARGASLARLQADRKLTPERLMKYVAGFGFEARRTVRSAEEFVGQERGDCDDFATLAADLLRRRGYTTRLVAVFMPGQVHVVCYVAEVGGYLDYNRRKEREPLVKCEGELGSIATSVARSFHGDWVSASEYTFQHGEAHFVLTEFH
jgi:transglutaminase-like putative cysteine protease